MDTSQFYLRYYDGHKGRYGQEFLEFEINSEGRLRYGNHSNYKSDGLIKREVYLNKIIVKDICRIIEESEIMRQDDKNWPRPNNAGKQELEIRYLEEGINFITSTMGTSTDLHESLDPAGMQVLYYFVQDIKTLIFSIINMHFKVRPC